MVEFNDITLSAGKQKKRGTLTWVSNPPPATIDFKSKTSTKPVSIRLADITSFSWSQQFGGYEWKIGLVGGTIVKFSGFTQAALADIEQLAKQKGIDIKTEVVSTKGTNAGTLEITDQSLIFSVEGNTAFELPMHLIAQAVAQSKNEVALELVHDENAAAQQQSEALVEMRIHIPDISKPPKESKTNDEYPTAEHSTIESDEELAEQETPATLFARDLQIRGDIGLTSTQSLASFEKLLFAVPRGRYDVELFPLFLKLQSASYTYKINYKNVNKMFLFDLIDSGNHLFVIGLNPPVRQGRTAYPYLVVQFDSSEYLEQKFPAIDEKTAEEKYGGLMKPFMKGPSHDVVTRVFKALTKKKVLIPGKGFVGQRGGASIQCSYKANEGHLFFLERSFFFLKKPPMHIRHAAVTSIEFDRMSSANKRFGMKITTNEQKGNEYMFTNISRDEFDGVYAFLSDKGLNLIRHGDDEPHTSRRAQRDDFSDDAYMKRLEADAEEAGGGGGGGGDESDSENDEDFTVASDAESSGDDSQESGSDAEERPRRKKKSATKKLRGGEEKDGGDEGGEGDDDEEGGEEESKNKPKGRKSKRKRPVDEQPRQISPYSLYQKAKRPQLQAEHPDMDFGKINALIGESWRKESKEKRAEYEQQAEALTKEARAKYRADKEAQSSQSSSGSGSSSSSSASEDEDEGRTKQKKKKKKKKKRVVDPNAPKRPVNAYVLYSQAERGNLPAGLTVQEKMHKLGEQWKTLEPEKKKEYEDQAAELKEKYVKEMEAYNKGKGGKKDTKKTTTAATAVTSKQQKGEKDVVNMEEDAEGEVTEMKQPSKEGESSQKTNSTGTEKKVPASSSSSSSSSVKPSPSYAANNKAKSGSVADFFKKSSPPSERKEGEEEKQP